MRKLQDAAAEPAARMSLRASAHPCRAGTAAALDRSNGSQRVSSWAGDIRPVALKPSICTWFCRPRWHSRMSEPEMIRPPLRAANGALHAPHQLIAGNRQPWEKQRNRPKTPSRKGCCQERRQRRAKPATCSPASLKRTRSSAPPQCRGPRARLRGEAGLYRQAHRGSGRARAGPPPPRHVYRRHRREGAASSVRRSHRQRHGRGARRPRRLDRGRDGGGRLR